MPKIKFTRLLNIRSEKLRALLHEAWKHGNNSTNIHEEPAGEVERREYITQALLTAGYAMVVPDNWVNCTGCGKLGEPTHNEHFYCGIQARCHPGV